MNQKVHAIIGAILDNLIWGALMLSNGALFTSLVSMGISIAFLAIRYVAFKKGIVATVNPNKLYGLSVAIVSAGVAIYYSRQDIAVALVAISIVSSICTAIEFVYTPE